MKLYIKLDIAGGSGWLSSIEVLHKWTKGNWPANQLLLTEVKDHETILEVSGPGIKAWLIGDPVLGSRTVGEIAHWLLKGEYQNLVLHIGGHYRFISINRRTGTFAAGCSLFNILPLYYTDTPAGCSVSTSPEVLARANNLLEPDKRFILENILFYYPLFNRSPYEDVHLLPANTILEWSCRGMQLIKHSSIRDWLAPDPMPWPKACESMAGVFMDRVRYYLPDTLYSHSLTGGFDSRTLVATALFHRKAFTIYSFGKSDSTDVVRSRKIADRFNLPFQAVDLDEEYVSDESYPLGREFIENSFGTAGFARAHYLYACKRLAGHTNYLVTGNFGSEIFRAAHLPGAVISPNLYRLFQADSFAEAVTKLERSEEWHWINRSSFAQEWESLRDDLSRLPHFSLKMNPELLNQYFYELVFEEVFRKYFGAEMQNQYEWLCNRTPFLDPPFLLSLLQTGLAGVYARFFDHHPVRRFKGQVLYAHIIRQSFAPLGRPLTDKGYPPHHLLSLPGKAFIAAGYLRKKIAGRRQDDDPHRVNECYRLHWKRYLNTETDSGLFNIGNLSAPPAGQHSHIIALSQAWHHSRLKVANHEPIIIRQPG